MEPYTERGGSRWGPSPMVSSNVTWPFAEIRVSPQGLEIRVSVLGFAKRTFAFDRAEVTRVASERGVFHTGLRIEHRTSNPTHIVFWTFHGARLSFALREAGYELRTR